MAASNNVNSEQFFHGTPSGDLRGGHYGLHVGTERAAREALEARIGTPAEGTWDGTRVYGMTKLKGNFAVNSKTGERDTSADFYPDEKYKEGGGPRYSDSSPVSLNAVPEIIPVKLTGEMTNTPETPHDDYAANRYMAAQKKMGRARRGYFYRNVAEDEGSISAVVPDGSHVERLDSPYKQLRLF